MSELELDPNQLNNIIELMKKNKVIKLKSCNIEIELHSSAFDPDPPPQQPTQEKKETKPKFDFDSIVTITPKRS